MTNKLEFKDLWFNFVLFFGLSINKLIHYINTGKTALLINSYAELIILAIVLSVICSKVFMICSEKYTLVGKRKIVAGIMTVVLLYATAYMLLVGWMYLVNYNPRNHNLLYEIVLEEDAPYITGLIASLTFIIYYLYKMKFHIINPEIDYYEPVANEMDVSYRQVENNDKYLYFWRKVYKAECEGVIETDDIINADDTKAYLILHDQRCIGYFLTRSEHNTVEVFEGYVSGFVRDQLMYYYQAVLKYLNTLKTGTRIEFTNLSPTKSTYKKLEFQVLEIFSKEYSGGKNYDIICDNNGTYQIILKTRGDYSEIES